jgi:hypothetical protein
VIVESSTPAGDALGIVSSVIKVLARSIVIVYGSWVTIGTIDLVFTTVSTFKDTGDYALAKIIGTVPLITAGLTSPISTFFIFTFAMLSIEWTSEILGINRRLEAIARLFRNSSQNAVQKQ